MTSVLLPNMFDDRDKSIQKDKDILEEKPSVRVGVVHEAMKCEKELFIWSQNDPLVIPRADQHKAGEPSASRKQAFVFVILPKIRNSRYWSVVPLITVC